MKKVLALTLAFMVFFSGCYTKTVPTTKINNIDEKIVAFMLKEDDKSLIIIGEKYHYIFEPNEKFEYLLKNKKETFKLDIENGYYSLDKKAFARFYVEIDEEKSSKDFLLWAYENEARKHKVKNENKQTLKLEIEMNGKYYIPNSEINNAIPKLDKQYHIKVKKWESVNKEVEVSPIKEATKGTFIIVAIGIAMVVLLPFFLFGHK